MQKNERMSKKIMNYDNFIKIYIYQIWHAMFRGQNQDSCDCGPKRGLGQPVQNVKPFLPYFLVFLRLHLQNCSKKVTIQKNCNKTQKTHMRTNVSKIFKNYQKLHSIFRNENLNSCDCGRKRGPPPLFTRLCTPPWEFCSFLAPALAKQQWIDATKQVK